MLLPGSPQGTEQAPDLLSPLPTHRRTPGRGFNSPLPPFSLPSVFYACHSLSPAALMRTVKGHEEDFTDGSPSSSRSLPVTSSFSKMVSCRNSHSTYTPSESPG